MGSSGATEVVPGAGTNFTDAASAARTLEGLGDPGHNTRAAATPITTMEMQHAITTAAAVRRLALSGHIRRLRIGRPLQPTGKLRPGPKNQLRNLFRLPAALTCSPRRDDEGPPTLVGFHGRKPAMSISAVGNAAGYVPQVRSQQAGPAPKAAVASVGGDSDGDNDGSKGATVDVRA
jgi:hypothetical protein